MFVGLFGQGLQWCVASVKTICNGAEQVLSAVLGSLECSRPREDISDSLEKQNTLQHLPDSKTIKACFCATS